MIQIVKSKLCLDSRFQNLFLDIKGKCNCRASKLWLLTRAPNERRERQPLPKVSWHKYKYNVFWIWWYNDMIIMYSCNRGQSWRSGCVNVNAIGCGFDSHSRNWNVYLNLYLNFVDVELAYWRNASRIRKIGNRVSWH